MLFYCRACRVTYDGNAQCCLEMDHIIIPEDQEEDYEIDFEKMKKDMEDEE